MLGVPACALYYKTTFLDFGPAPAARRARNSRAELARLGEGGDRLGRKIVLIPSVPLASRGTSGCLSDDLYVAGLYFYSP